MAITVSYAAGVELEFKWADNGWQVDGKKEGVWTWWRKDGSIDYGSHLSGMYKAGKKIAPFPKK